MMDLLSSSAFRSNLHQYTRGNAWFDDDGRRLTPDETGTAEEKYDDVLAQILDVGTGGARHMLLALATPSTRISNEADSACHIIDTRLKYRFLSAMASCEVASGVWQALCTGTTDATLTVSAAAEKLIALQNPTAGWCLRTDHSTDVEYPLPPPPSGVCICPPLSFRSRMAPELQI